MARLILSDQERALLRLCLQLADSGTYIPDWEFSALFGCTRPAAIRSLAAGIQRIELRGERPRERMLDRMLLLLNALLGASQHQTAARGEDAALPCDELEQLIQRLTEQPPSARRSGVSMRQGATRERHGESLDNIREIRAGSGSTAQRAVAETTTGSTAQRAAHRR